MEQAIMVDALSRTSAAQGAFGRITVRTWSEKKGGDFCSDAISMLGIHRSKGSWATRTLAEEMAVRELLCSREYLQKIMNTFD